MFRTVVASSLLLTANLQLQRLLLRTPQGVAMAALLTRRYCQDDSKKRKQKILKTKDTSQRKVVKASGPAVNLLEKDLLDILAELPKREKIQERSSLQRRIDLLLSLGCTMDQIQDNVEALKLSEQVILRRATMLKEVGRTHITVPLLLTARQSSTDQLVKHLSWKDELDKALCTILQCSPKELLKVKKEHLSLTRFRGVTAKDIFEKVRVMHDFGVTQQEIKAFPQILNIRVRNIEERLRRLKTLRDKGELHFERYPLNIVVERTRTFEIRIHRAMVGQAELDGSPITSARIAERLGVTAKDVEDASINFFKINPSSVLKKIDYLLEQGIPSTDIISHIYMMRYHQDMIEWAVQESKRISAGNPSIYIILSLLRSGRLPKRSYIWSRQRTYVASLLEVSAQSLPSTTYIRPLWSAERLNIKRNYDFLVSEGYSREDILSCLILLAHDTNSLQSYYRGLWERPEVAAYVEDEGWRENKKQVLSLLQYVMEKDMNFSSAVFHEDVEYDQGLVAKEPQDLNSSVTKEVYNQDSDD